MKKTSLIAALGLTAGLLAGGSAANAADPTVTESKICSPGSTARVSGTVPGATEVVVVVWFDGDDVEEPEYQKTYPIKSTFDLKVQIPRYDATHEYVAVYTSAGDSSPAQKQLTKLDEQIFQVGEELDDVASRKDSLEEGGVAPEEEAEHAELTDQYTELEQERDSLEQEWATALEAVEREDEVTTLNLLADGCENNKPIRVVTGNLGAPDEPTEDTELQEDVMPHLVELVPGLVVKEAP